jgi:mannose-6-phosphate isomerase-like protein (cupin superfamily)
VADNINFHVIVLKPGSSQEWAVDKTKVRICSVASGKVKVKLGDTEIVIGPNGMFKIAPGVTCAAMNRLYLDVVLHVVTVETF